MHVKDPKRTKLDQLEA